MLGKEGNIILDKEIAYVKVKTIGVLELSVKEAGAR